MTKNRSATRLTYVERVNRVIDHIVNHLSEPMPLAGLARIAKLSPFHFHRVFQALAGETPADFVRRLRLERALNLMTQHRGQSLTTIALKCGFASSSDFSRSFKQRYGVAPSGFDLASWQRQCKTDLESSFVNSIQRLPARANPDRWHAKIRHLLPRTVAYIAVSRPYEGDAVIKATHRLMAWAQRNGCADHQWLGYQWDNPEITSLKDCRYYVAVEADQFTPKGEIGRYRFPAMDVAEVTMRGDIAMELRALQWLYGSWLPRSGFVPDDQPAFEAWIGRPFAHGMDFFTLHIHLPIRKP